MQSLLAQLTEIGALFAGVAATDPVSALLLLLGAVLTGGSAAALGLLALGAALDLVAPTPS